ncbi:Hypothetical protein CHISP_1030 [Chitinispirillum alkaliphilum]|nr:Hypothetical protein CHISP_1030 [Chitinispirillum alkaliphilum]
MNAKVSKTSIVDFLDKTLNIGQIKDVSRNGLQVEGEETITSVALAVDACMEAYRQSVESGCQMLITHHGIIWDGLRSITGSAYRHLKYLLDNNLNLYAAHLPLDLHPEYGNNAILAKTLKLENVVPFGNYKGVMIGFEGTLPESLNIKQISSLLDQYIGEQALLLPFGPQKIRRVAVVSGGASGELGEAITKGADLYITGESSHENYHQALEAGINVLYCGHYHSEKPGVIALGRLIKEQFGVETIFLDIPTTI